MLTVKEHAESITLQTSRKPTCTGLYSISSV